MFWPWLTLVLVAALVWLHLWWRKRYNHVLDQQTSALARARDEHQVAVANLHAQQETLFNSMTEGLLLLDKDGRIQVFNRTFSSIFGITGDIRSRTVLEVLRLHELATLIASVTTRGGAVNTELRISRPTDRWLDVNAAAIADTEGTRQGTVIVFHDLSRLKLLENTRRDFVANVSHELRTPLSLIKGYVETLLDGAQSNPDLCAKFLKTIERNAERLRLLIEDLLVISELESGTLLLNLQPTQLQAVIGKLAEDFRTRTEAKHMELVDRCPPMSVLADAGRLEQVVTNLLDNAVKYGRSGGCIEVGAEPAADPAYVRVFVRDDGPGIPADALERVFERFFRVDKARSREQGGTGLGLSIVKHIVQSHGGKAWAESTPGDGASFFFTLRVASEKHAASEKVPVQGQTA